MSQPSSRSSACTGTSDHIASPDLEFPNDLLWELDQMEFNIPENAWDHAYGSVTIRKVREVFPMFELTVDSLTAATKKLMVRV